MKLNLNVNVRVRLTGAGLAQLQRWERDVYAGMYDQYRQRPKDGVFYTFQLWELMNIFGSMMHMGMLEVPFVDNVIHFDVKELEE